MKLWLVRHAQPLVAAGVCYGATDLAADPAATRQAAAALAGVLPTGLPVVASPLQRCGQLAQALAALRPDLAVRTDVRIAEMDFGCWEGCRWDAIGQGEIERWTAGFGYYRFGGRESVNDLMARVSAARVDCSALPGSEVAWITHAGVIRAAGLLARGIQSLDRADQWPSEAIGFGQWRLENF